jgi:hypothetical protein
MSPRPFTSPSDAFRTAVEARDFVRAQQHLQEYFTWFRSGPRTAHEMEQARDLLEYGLQITRARKAGISEELMLLRSVFDAYRPPRRFHTWRLEG